MTALDWALALVALFGHAALWIGAYNRLHALSLPVWLATALEKLILLALAAAPPIAIWLLARDDALPAPAVWGYGMLCWVVALGPGLFWLLRRSAANPRTVLLSNHSTYRNAAAELNRPLLHGVTGNVLGRVPGNEILKLEINEKTLRLPELPEELRGLSIVHLTDLHFTGRIDRAYFEYVVEEANRLEGDFVAVTGDLVDKAACLPWIPETLGRLRARCGVFGVLGNHDKRLRELESLRQIVRSSGVTLLGGRWIEAPLRGARVLLAGDELPWFGPGPDLRHAPAPDSAFRILLAHTPDRFFWAQENQFRLMLAGHNHGGQIRLPVLGPVVTPSRYGVKYSSGVFRENGTVMHVSRGVSGEHPLRFNCLPELTKLVLVLD